MLALTALRPLRRIHIVEALQQLEHGGLAGAAGTHQSHGFSRPKAEAELRQGGLTWTRWVVEIDRIEFDGQPLAALWQFERLRGGRHWRLARQQLHQPLGGASGAQQIPIDLAQHSSGAGKQAHVEHRLAQVARRHGASQHRLGSPVKAPEQQGGVGNDDESHQRGTRA